MIYRVPALESTDLAVIEQIERARENLRHALGVPRRWGGLLRRSTVGLAIRGSNSIEGYRIEKRDVVAAAEGESLQANDETANAISGYRRAMTHVLHLASDPHFVWSEQTIKSLHFMMLEHDLDKSPGHWRSGPIFVYDEDRRRQVYEGPDFALVPDLMRALVDKLAETPEDCPVVVKAAMAHLNLAMIHPFRDGNGRMARCLQTLVLGRGGTLEPTFSSIEEYLGRHHFPYYQVLADVGRGTWQPERDARSFVRFCLRAHFYQAKTILRRIREGERLWDILTAEATARGFMERTVLALWDAASGFQVANGTYRSAADVSTQVASRELTALAEAGLLVAEGEKRGRRYSAAPILLQMRERTLDTEVIPDPYPGQPATD